ncbi:MAG: hypothetical protein ABUU24_09055 [Variovorax sp.]|jgi:hypothetical protein
MNTHPLSAPWPLSLSWHPLKWLQARWRTQRQVSPEHDDGLEDLIELDVRMLNDIGAPQRLLSIAHAHREAQLRCRDDLLAGSSSAGWRHW